jgi:hypothetical protein
MQSEKCKLQNGAPQEDLHFALCLFNLHFALLWRQRQTEPATSDWHGALVAFL